MIIHRHKTHEHRTTRNGDEGSTARHRNQPHRCEAQNSGSMAGRKAADIVATLKRMETVLSVADERWIISGPSLRPIATANIPQRCPEFIGHNQAEAGDQQHFLQAHKWSPRPSNHQQRQDQRRPGLQFWRRVGEPAENLELVDLMMIDKERNRSINPKVTDQHRSHAESHCDQRTSQQFAIVSFGYRRVVIKERARGDSNLKPSDP